MIAFKTLALVLSATLAIASGLPATSADDPPPHPTNCPLCGGNPQVHVDKTFQVLARGARAAGHALRW